MYNMNIFVSQGLGCFFVRFLNSQQKKSECTRWKGSLVLFSFKVLKHAMALKHEFLLHGKCDS